MLFQEMSKEQMVEHIMEKVMVLTPDERLELLNYIIRDNIGEEEQQRIRS